LHFSKKCPCQWFCLLTASSCTFHFKHPGFTAWSHANVATLICVAFAVSELNRVILTMAVTTFEKPASGGLPDNMQMPNFLKLEKHFNACEKTLEKAKDVKPH